MWRTGFFVILGHFFHVCLPDNLKNQNFEKNEKVLGDIIFLHMRDINEDHMISAEPRLYLGMPFTRATVNLD